MTSPSKRPAAIAMTVAKAPITPPADLVLGAPTSITSTEDDTLLTDLAADRLHVQGHAVRRG